MNMKKGIHFTALIFTLALIYGCSNQPTQPSTSGTPIDYTDEDFSLEDQKVDEISASGDLNACTDIIDLNLRTLCIQNIVTTDAVKSKDPLKCEQIQDVLGKENCEIEAKLAS